MSSTKFPDRRSPSLDLEQRIDHWCLSFENAWLAKETPDLAAFLQQAEDDDRASLLRELLPLDVLYRHRQGEKPVADDYLSLDAPLREVVAEFFQAGHASAPTVGDVIGRFELLELIGRGGFGDVFRACDRDLGRQVAIKTPRVDQAWSACAALTFLEEARIAAQLSHPRLAPVYDVGRLPDGGCYLVMPLLDGQSLHDRYGGRPAAVEDAARIVTEVADAVAAIHQAGLVHRDLSPDNILLDSDDCPMIIDFGLAMFLRDARRRVGEMAGSHRYMAPEQLQVDAPPLDPRADVWALGAILFELLYGATPFSDKNPERLTEKILREEPEIPANAARVPPAIRAICMKCLRKSPSERFGNARQLADGLRDWRQSRRTRRQVLLTGGAAVGASAASALAIMRFQQPATAASPPLHLSLLVFREHWRTLAPTAPLVLRDGDQIRIHASASRELFMYLLWREADGNLQPLYPFLRGSWELPASPARATEVPLPSEDPQEAWPMRVFAPGYEVLWLLGAGQPLPEAAVERLQEILSRPLPQVASSEPWTARFSNGAPQYHRGPLTLGTRHVRDELARTQRALAEELSRWFDQIESLCVPVA